MGQKINFSESNKVYELDGEKYLVVADNYKVDNRLAVCLYNSHGVCDAVITVNLSNCYHIGKEYAYIDTNNYPEIDKDFLIKYELAKPTGLYDRSGYCLYPLYKFNLEKLVSIEEFENIEFYKNE